MNSIGSPEWFKDEASKYEEFQKEIENLRDIFGITWAFNSI